MDVDSLLAALSEPGLPEAALAAAMAEPETVAPALLARLDDYLASRAPGDAPPQWLFFAVHLLGSMRWAPAYRSVMRLLAGDREAVDAALGDALADSAVRVVYSLFDGDWAPVRGAAASADADPYIRWGMFELLGRLALDGRIPREEVAAFLRLAQDEDRLGDDAAVWHGWAAAAELLGLREFKPRIERGYAEGRLDPRIASKRSILESIEHTAASGRPQDVVMRLEPFPEDIVAEFRTWHFADPDRDWPDRRAAEPPPAWSLDADAPVRNPFRHVGRNDPCPCGSGRKFKKCCLAAG